MLLFAMGRLRLSARKPEIGGDLGGLDVSLSNLAALRAPAFSFLIGLARPIWCGDEPMSGSDRRIL